MMSADNVQCKSSSDSQGHDVTPEEELINVILSSDKEPEKLDKLSELIRKGVNVDYQSSNHDNNTALHIALHKKDLQIIETLIKYGANINVTNNKNKTPLNIAQRNQDIFEIFKHFSRSRFSLDRHQVQGQEERVYVSLQEFVKYFVKEFEMKLQLHHMLLGRDREKTGRYAEAYLDILGEGTGAALAGTMDCVMLAHHFSGGVVGLGSLTKRTKGSALERRLESSDYGEQGVTLAESVHNNQCKDAAGLKKTLVKAGYDIFQSYEMQFMKVSKCQTHEAVMKILAKAAIDRASHQLSVENVTPFTENSIANAVVSGGCKTLKTGEIPSPTSVQLTSLATPGFKTHFTDAGGKDKKWNTSSLFEKPGLVIEQKLGGNEEKKRFYFKKKGSKTKKYGYRRLLTSESWENVKKEYESDPKVREESTDYVYFLRSENIDNESQRIFEIINQSDEDLFEDVYQEAVSDVTYILCPSFESSHEEMNDIPEGVIRELINADKVFQPFRKEARYLHEKVKDEVPQELQSIHEITELLDETTGQHLGTQGQKFSNESEKAFLFNCDSPVRFISRRDEELSDLRKAFLLESQGKYEEAYKMYDDVLKKLKSDDQLVFTIRRRIVGLHIAQGNLEAAEEVLDELYRIQENTLGSSHEDTLCTLNILAMILYKQCKYDSAFEIFQKCHKNFEQKLGPYHAYTLNALSNIIVELIRKHKLGEALECLNKVCEQLERGLGTNHPSTLISLVNKATILDKLFRHDEALEIFQKICPKVKTIFGTNHEHTILSLNNYARALSHAHESKESLQIYNQIHGNQRIVYGTDHPNTFIITFNFAVALFEIGKYEEALPLFEEVREKLAGQSGPDIEKVLLKTAKYISEIYGKEGKRDQTLDIHENVRTLEKKISNSDHDDSLHTEETIPNIDQHSFRTHTKVCVENLAENEYDEILKGLNEIRHKMGKNLGRDHPDSLSILNNIAIVLTIQGKYNEALEKYEKVFTKRLKILGVDHLDTLITCKEMAHVLFKLGKHDAALQKYKDVYEKLSPDHPLALISHGRTAEIHLSQGKFEKAFKDFDKLYETQEYYIGYLQSPTHKSITSSNVGNTSKTHFEQVENLEAHNFYTEIYKMKKRILTTFAQKAQTLANVSKHSEACKIYEQICDKMEVTFGLEHRHTLATLTNYAISLYNLNDHNKALRIFKEIFEREKKVYGPDHPDTLWTCLNIAMGLYFKGDYDEALLIFQDVHIKMKHQFGPDHALVSKSTYYIDKINNRQCK